MCALAQQRALVDLNVEFEQMGLPAISIRVGLHTGSVLTGNIGSEQALGFIPRILISSNQMLAERKMPSLNRQKMKFGCMGTSSALTYAYIVAALIAACR